MKNATNKNQAKQIKKDVLKNSSKNKLKESPLKTVTRRNSLIEQEDLFNQDYIEFGYGFGTNDTSHYPVYNMTFKNGEWFKQTLYVISYIND